jgi:hypothetical protein
MKHVTALMAFSVMLFVVAANPGISSITITPNSIVMYPGSFVSVPYSVSVVAQTSGNTLPTALLIVNNAYNLSNYGIATSTTDSFDQPAFNGSINVSVSQFTPLGNYTVILQAYGGMPSGPANLGIDIINETIFNETYLKITPPTTTINASINQTAFTTVPVNASQNQSSSIPYGVVGNSTNLGINSTNSTIIEGNPTNTLLGYVIVIVVVIAVIAVLYVIRKSK